MLVSWAILKFFNCINLLIRVTYSIFWGFKILLKRTLESQRPPIPAAEDEFFWKVKKDKNNLKMTFRARWQHQAKILSKIRELHVYFGLRNAYISPLPSTGVPIASVQVRLNANASHVCLYQIPSVVPSQNSHWVRKAWLSQGPKGSN